MLSGNMTSHNQWFLRGAYVVSREPLCPVAEASTVRASTFISKEELSLRKKKQEQYRILPNLLPSSPVRLQSFPVPASLLRLRGVKQLMPSLKFLRAVSILPNLFLSLRPHVPATIFLNVPLLPSLPTMGIPPPDSLMSPEFAQVHCPPQGLLRVRMLLSDHPGVSLVVTDRRCSLLDNLATESRMVEKRWDLPLDWEQGAAAGWFSQQQLVDFYVQSVFPDLLLVARSFPLSSRQCHKHGMWATWCRRV